MDSRIIRTRFYFPVEGEGEKSFITWLQHLCNTHKLFVHLDCHVLCGGGYEIMLNEAIRQRKRKERFSAKCSILIIDADRNHHDAITIEQLQMVAIQNNFNVYVQYPNLEGMFVKLLSKSKVNTKELTPNEIKNRLNKLWPDYKKPADAYSLHHKFSIDDLLRVAKYDGELKKILDVIGLNSNNH